MRRIQALLLAAAVVAGIILWRLCSPEGGGPAARPADAELGRAQSGPAGNPVPAGSLLAEKASFVFAVFHPQKPPTDPAQAVSNLLAMRELDLRLEKVADQDTRPPVVVVRQTDTENYPVPPDDLLRYFGRGLSEKDLERLRGAQDVTTLWFLGSKDNFLKTLKAACLLVEDLARQTDGLIWDEETRECFTPDAWHRRRLDSWKAEFPPVPDHIVLHAYSTGELNRGITLGMAKFGLPDIYIRDFPRAYATGMGILLNFIAQWMVEKPGVETAGLLALDLASLSTAREESEKLEGRADIPVAVGTRDEGDPMNRLIEVVFPGDQKSLNVRQEALLAKLFGPGSEGVVSMEHNQEILAASRQARKHLIETLKPKFQAGLAPSERLSVKAPFKTPAGRQEWMWIEVVRWEGQEISGILMNDPYYIPGLKSGARVETHENAVFDYIHELPDGSSEGNQTGKIMQRPSGQAPPR